MKQIADILKTARTIAVVGLSAKRYRPSYGVAEYLQKARYRIIPVNPLETELLGERCYPDLEAVPEAVDIVDIFRRSEFVPEIVEAAIRKGAKVVWMRCRRRRLDARCRNWESPGYRHTVRRRKGEWRGISGRHRIVW